MPGNQPSRRTDDKKSVRSTGPDRERLLSWYARSRQRSWSDLRTVVPGALASLLVHAAVLFLCTLFIVAWNQDEPPELELDWSVARSANSSAGDVVNLPEVLPPDDTPVNSAALAATSTDSAASLNQAPPSSKVSPVKVEGTLQLRQNRQQRPVQFLKEGRETPEAAIDAALQWLVQQQFDDGHWSLQGPYLDGGSIETCTGATALALLCFLGDGHTHDRGDHQDCVAKGLLWLKGTQRSSGDLFDILEEGKEAHFYAHSQATTALCEALAMTGDESLRPAAERAVAFLVQAQNPVRGGWKYRPLTETGIGDLSVTGWALMALHSARMARIDVPVDTFQLASRFLDSVEVHPGDGSQYKYRPDLPDEETQRWSMTAEGLVCRQWLGWPRNEPALVKGMQHLTSVRNLPVWGANQRNAYAWYYTAQALHNMGGPEWDKWYSTTGSILVKNQQRTGALRGSWHPMRPEGAFHERSRDGGRLYLTALCVLILETPFRHVSVYD